MELAQIRDMDNKSPSATTCQTRPGMLQTQNPLSSTFQQSIRKLSNNEDPFEYEKVLQDTPPGTPGRLVTKNQSLFNYLDAANDSADDIIMTIEASLGEKVSNNNNEGPEKDGKSERQISFSDQTTEAGDGEDLLDSNPNKMFEKAGKDVIDRTYMEAKQFKSFLSSGIKNVPSPRDGTNYIKKGELRTFRVYFFNREISLFVPLNISLKVIDIIHQCLDAYKSNKTMDQALLKYPDEPNAYDIKMGHNSIPLDKKIEFKTLPLPKGLGELTITEISDFEKSTNDNENPVVVYVNLPDPAKTRVFFEARLDNVVKDIYLLLTTKKIAGYTPQFYHVRVYQDSESKTLDSKSLPFLELQLPLRNLKKHIKDDTLSLELVKKRFADDPTENNVQTDIIKEYTPSPGENEMKEKIILYNEVSAHQYEEFELIKINDSGKRQVRILGIDGFKIYNYSQKYKQEQLGKDDCTISDRISSMFYSKFGTVHPEWLIGNIHSIEFVEPSGMVIQMIIEGNQLKRLVYEASDRRDVKQIVAKVRYLKDLENKKIVN